MIGPRVYKNEGLCLILLSFLTSVLKYIGSFHKMQSRPHMFSKTLCYY